MVISQSGHILLWPSPLFLCHMLCPILTVSLARVSSYRTRFPVTPPTVTATPIMTSVFIRFYSPIPAYLLTLR
jgi:hypothetical protein